jgi:hypothetical protein
MTRTHSSIATDSETDLRELIGDDATATFEDDPKFIESNPGAEASSENVELQRDTDDVEEDDEDDDEEDEDDDDVDEAEEDDTVDVDELDIDRVVAA